LRTCGVASANRRVQPNIIPAQLVLIARKFC
jgi:hypothetical protein